MELTRGGGAISNALEPDGLVLKVSGLRKHFSIQKGLFGRTVGHVKAVDGVDFTINRARPWGWSARAAAASRPPDAACCAVTT